MKLSFVEISGFRGFKHKTRFNFPAGFVVLTGRNGAGKSTVLDAVDFVLTGSINKYAVKGAKGGGLDEHIWWVGEGTSTNEYASIGFVDEHGEEFVITRSRESGLDMPTDKIARNLCSSGYPTTTWPETLVQTTLIRDETIAGLSLDLPEQARFAAVRAAIGGLAGPDHTKRTSALLGTATTAKTTQERRVADAQAELGRALSALTEARSIAERQADVAEVEKIIATLIPELPGAIGERVELLRRHIAQWKQTINIVAELLPQAENLQAERRYFESEEGMIEVAAAHAELTSAQQAYEQAGQNLINAQRLESLEQERDALVSRMIALLDHGEALGLQAGHCPLCDAVRTSEEFTSAIAAGRSKLGTRGAETARAIAAVEQARIAVEQAKTLLAKNTERVGQLEARQKKLVMSTQSLATTLAKWNLAVSPTELESLRILLLKKQEDVARLEHALFILEASSAHERVAALEARVEQLRAYLDGEIAKFTATERAVEVARQIDHAAREIPNQVLTEQFDTVMPLLKELYQRLRPHMDWREIETDFGGRVRASLNFTVGNGHNPQFLFSSGQRRAAGVAFLLAIHLSRPWCRLQTLLLDDPVQHIDDFRALNLVEVLSAVRRTGRQVIVAVEDPALADVLCRRLRSTTLQAGRRFELNTTKDGSASIERQIDIFPLPREVLKTSDGR